MFFPSCRLLSHLLVETIHRSQVLFPRRQAHQRREDAPPPRHRQHQASFRARRRGARSPLDLPVLLLSLLSPSHVVYGVRHALPKILYAMDLSLPSEAHQAEAMLEQWPQLPVEDALQLLGKEIRLPAARAYAVKQLDRWEKRERVM